MITEHRLRTIGEQLRLLGLASEHARVRDIAASLVGRQLWIYPRLDGSRLTLALAVEVDEWPGWIVFPAMSADDLGLDAEERDHYAGQAVRQIPIPDDLEGWDG